MYLVIHGDTARGEAIVEALGGEPAALLAGSAHAAGQAARERGPPSAVVCDPNVVDDLLAVRVTMTPGLKDAPFVFDGGRTGPVYRCFAAVWRWGRTFHHLRSATPEAVAREAVRVAEIPVPPSHTPTWHWILVAGLGGALLATLVAPGLLPEWFRRAFSVMAGPVALAYLFLLPAGAALAHGIRPSKGAVAWAAIVALQLAMNLASASVGRG